jgi:hypothetical protein
MRLIFLATAMVLSIVLLAGCAPAIQFLGMMAGAVAAVHQGTQPAPVAEVSDHLINVLEKRAHVLGD